jgi:hypothetical protein
VKVCTIHTDGFDWPEHNQRDVVDTSCKNDKKHAEEWPWCVNDSAREEGIRCEKEFPDTEGNKEAGPNDEKCEDVG